MKILLILLASFLPSNYETTVYIDEVSIQNSIMTINYRIDDSLPQSVSKPYNENESIITLPKTTVRIGWSWEWVFNEYDFIVDCEPNTKIIWTY